jgi:catechol 2,3-dioxygenase-like lactoylglutathione lyase family enzyme
VKDYSVDLNFALPIVAAKPVNWKRYASGCDCGKQAASERALPQSGCVLGTSKTAIHLQGPGASCGNIMFIAAAPRCSASAPGSMTLGVNHITFAVTDLARSLAFYASVVGCERVAVWDKGAYLRAGGTWLCLTHDASVPPREDYTHVAFTFDAAGLASFRAKLAAAGGKEWKSNSSEGDSVYFLDPDGHRLEAHVGDLKSRVESLRKSAYAGLLIYANDG